MAPRTHSEKPSAIEGHKMEKAEREIMRGINKGDNKYTSSKC
jgi:hypothetical protein